MTAEDYQWPPITEASLRAGLAATTTADGIDALTNALADRCHSCGNPITWDTESPIADTCADCLAECPCWVCRETRDDMSEDRAEQVAFDASREAS